LFVEAENVLGSGTFSGAKQAEVTVGITQVVELWGRRRKRIDAASGGRGLAQRDYESARLRIAAVTASRFIGVVAARESVQLAMEAVKMAEEYHANLLLRAESGQGSKVEESRSLVDVESARMGLMLASKRLEAASVNLSAQWGGNFSGLEVAGNLDLINPAPRLAELQTLVRSHPDVLRWAAEQERVRHSLAYERVNARPDVAVGAGYRWLNGPDDSAFVFAASIPLPTFNRNQGNILEAKLNFDRAGDQEAAAIWRIRADLAHVWNRLLIAQSEVESIRNRLLPAAEKAQQEAMKYHDVARLSYLDIFETRRTFYQIKQRLLGALAEFHLARVELDALIGTLPGVPTTSPQP
jgi:cobalt-zinc-cadmium efflux system outer membrane protein